VNITPKGHHLNHHSVLQDKHGDTEPTPLPFFKHGQGHGNGNLVENLTKKLAAENNYQQSKSFKALKPVKKPEKQDENKEAVAIIGLNKKASIAGGVFPMLNISSESVSKAMTKENSKEDLILQRKQSFEKVNRKLVLREKNKTEESTSHLSVHHILLQNNNSSVYQRFNEILKDSSHADLKKYLKPYQQDEVSMIVKTVQDSPPQKVNRVRIRSTSGKKKPISSHQSVVKPRDSHSFIHEVTNASTHSGLKRKKTLGYEPPMSDLKLGHRSTSQELFHQKKSKDSFLLKHELLIDTDSEGRKTDEEHATGGSNTMESFESNTGFESFQTLPTKPDQKKPLKMNRGGSPMRYINPNRERSYLGQILQSQDNHNYVVTEANTSHTMYRKARKFKPTKVLLDNSRNEKTVNTGWENSTIEDYVHHTESKKSITKLNISNISQKLLDNSLVQSRRHTRVLKTKPDSESYLIKPSLMGKAHRVILDANKLNNISGIHQQPASKPRKSTAGIGKGNESFSTYGEHLKLINNSFVDIKPRSQSKKLRK